ncbi:MAG: hypothetical protein M1833_005924 [Piccolia ochrophora]|nr:MAG: hypothetical protein M1833_005924 [Piccolia ochrophora]
MSIPNRPLTSNLRHPSAPAAHAPIGQPSGLVSRINEKKLELENLRQLRDLSAGLAGQMQTLEEKLATLADGTEAVAAVLSNWHSVLRAIQMASTKIPQSQIYDDEQRPEDEDAKQGTTNVPLPQTLVRIPAQQQSSNAEHGAKGDEA